MVATVSTQDFDKKVLKSESPVLVAFRASWCVPSNDLAPAVEEIERELDGRIKAVAVDFDSDSKVCRRLGVTRVPVTMLIADGQVKDLVGGWTDKKVIREMVDRHMAPVTSVGVHNFAREVLSSPVPTLVHFDAAWCAASRQLIPTLDEVGQRFRGKAKVARIEFGGENAELCARYGIVRVPTMALFVNGKIEDQILGAMVGGTKNEGVRTSCVGLTSEQNVSQMLERFVA